MNKLSYCLLRLDKNSTGSWEVKKKHFRPYYNTYFKKFFKLGSNYLFSVSNFSFDWTLQPSSEMDILFQFESTKLSARLISRMNLVSRLLCNILST